MSRRHRRAKRARMQAILNLVLCFQPIQIPGVMNRHEALQLSGLIRTLLPNNNKDLDP